MRNKPNKLFAKKSLGQNFLNDKNVINKIISALNPQTGETIFEIGPGRGALTEKLLETGANIIAVELDRNLIPFLREKFAGFQNFNLIEDDALKINFAEIVRNSKSKLIANLPYYISTAILQKLIEQKESFSEMILMLQREVVERITAKPGTKERGFLTVLVEANFEAKKLFDVSPNAFSPVPKVWSSVARLITKELDGLEKFDKDLFRNLISISFVQKRKTILNNLKNSGENLNLRFENKGGVLKTLERLNIEPSRRAETLTLSEWKSLVEFLSEKKVENLD